MAVLHIPKARFDPFNKARTVKIRGRFDSKMVSKVGPEIRVLQAATLPITLDINSRGGEANALDQIHEILMLKLRGLRCPIITVVRNLAGSCAADLLSIGDFIYAFEGAKIHFHGTSCLSRERLTAGHCQSLAYNLRQSDHTQSEKLLAGRVNRLYRRYAENKTAIESSAKHTKPKIEAFAELLAKNVETDTAKKIIHETIEIMQQQKALADKFLPKASGKSGKEFELAIHNAILKSKLEKSNKGVALDMSEEAAYDFYLLKEFFTGRHNSFTVELMQIAARDFLPATILKDLGSKKPSAKARGKLMALYNDQIRDLLFFAAVLCMVLFTDENPLTPRDAYWLGIVDKVLPVKSSGTS